MANWGWLQLMFIHYRCINPYRFLGTLQNFTALELVEPRDTWVYSPSCSCLRNNILCRILGLEYQLRVAFSGKCQKPDLRGLTKRGLFTSQNEKHKGSSHPRLILSIHTALPDPGSSRSPCLQSEHVAFPLMLRRWLPGLQPSHPRSRQ